MSANRKWTAREDAEIMRVIERNPHNLHKCFILISDRIDRTPGAVENRWYAHVSKDPVNKAFFTASRHHVSMKRKNGTGETSNVTVWNKLMRALHSIGL